MTSDGELLRRYTESNSEDAFAELVGRHLDLVYSAALRQVNGDAPLAQEVAQLVFTDLARKSGSLVGRQALTGWLYTGTHYAATKAVRTEQRRHTREQEAHAMQELLHDPGPNPDWETLRPVLDTAMHELNEADREVILLRYFENRPHADIGEHLGLSENAARMKIERALEKLRTHLVSRGVTTTAAALSIVLSANAIQAAPVGLAVTISTAAALGGTTIATTATATAIKSIAMTTLQKTIIGATLSVAVGTGVYEAHQNSRLRTDAERLERQQASVTDQLQQLTGEYENVSNRLAASEANQRLKWSSVEASDYRQYIANLRAVGCPEQTIRDIIITDLDRTYAQRMAKLTRPEHYWQAPNPSARTRESSEVKAIEEEKRGVIGELLGIEADEDAKRRAGLPISYEEGFEFLSAGKRVQLREIDHEYRLKLGASDGAMPYRQVRDQQADAIRRNEIEEWRNAAIKTLLTPEELNEYELRVSRLTFQLTWATHAFEPSEQEFRSIFQIEKQFGRTNAFTGFVEPPDDPSTKQKFQTALKQALGEQRYAEYQRSSDPNFVNLYDIVRDTGLSKETTKTVYDLNRVAEQRAEAIRKDASLSPETRQTAFQQLGVETDREIAKLLGDSGFNLYRIQIGSRRDWR